MNSFIHVSRNSCKPHLRISFNDFENRSLYPDWVDTKSEIGRRLAQARKAQRMTLQNVCDLVSGLGVSTLNSYELGTRTLPIDIAKKLSPIYRVSAAFLLTVSNDRTEDALLDMYRHADERGKATIRRVAESESPSLNSNDLAA